MCTAKSLIVDVYTIYYYYVGTLWDHSRPGAIEPSVKMFLFSNYNGSHMCCYSV